MHFEVLSEDSSGKVALDILLPKILSQNDTFRVISYKGIGKVPPNMSVKQDAKHRILLNQLPRLLRGYGRAHVNFNAAVFIVCDLDNKRCSEFLADLLKILNQCNPKPLTRFCFAIEEGEAWLLGDIQAIEEAYPNAKTDVLNEYENDSICGTWELMADALFPGGAKALIDLGFQRVGEEKSRWAATIAPRMDCDNNKSASFNFFREKLLEMR